VSCHERWRQQGQDVGEDEVFAAALLDEAMCWLREQYRQFEFWAERDVVWTLQTRLRRIIGERQLRYEVFNDYPLLPPPRHCGARGFGNPERQAVLFQSLTVSAVPTEHSTGSHPPQRAPEPMARRGWRSPDRRYLAGLSPVPAASRCTG
jgi:hypothetical protein